GGRGRSAVHAAPRREPSANRTAGTHFLRRFPGLWRRERGAPPPRPLLRTRRERPCRSTAEQRDEIASPHGRLSSGLGRTYHTVAQEPTVHYSKNCAMMSQMGQTRPSK